MSTQFNENYRKWARVTKTTIRIHHRLGDEMEVDWVGTTIDSYDSVTGDISPTYLFLQYFHAAATCMQRCVQT